jgi:hypothetical protein
MMTNNEKNDFEDRLDEIRVKKYEEMQRLGQEEYDKGMDARVSEAVRKYGIVMADAAPCYPVKTLPGYIVGP